MDSDGGHAHSLTASLDRDAAAPRWSGDGREIFFEYPDQGDTKIGVVDLNGKMRTVAENLGGSDIARPYAGGSFAVARNGRFVYTRSSPDAPPALATGTSKGDIVTLTHFSDPILSQRTLGKVEEIKFKSGADQRVIQGWIVTPPGFDLKKKYPLLLEIHGGPFASYEPSFAAEMQLYAAGGYVVLYCNPRGSTSYGREFGNLIHHDYPDKDYDDLLSGVDAVVSRGFIDTERLFVTGGSGGGVLTAWIVGHTDRFRAAVVVKPVINWTSFVLTGDETNFFYRYWFEGFPWDAQNSYWKRSPLAYAGQVKTPTLVMVGEADYRTPPSEAEQFYQALRLRRIDTALVRVPNASHDIAARPSLLNANVLYVMGWFKAHDKPGS
jgi:acylaminoacyl-peptidase